MREFKMRRKMLSSLPLETERLIIRYIAVGDAEDMYEYASVPEVSKYLLWSPHINIDATRGYVESLQKRYERGLYGDWALALKSTGKMIGTCGYANIDSRNMVCEIGYVLSPYYRHSGYMTEALEEILKLTFEKLGFREARLRIMNENADSKKLAERVGFRLDRVIENEIEVKGSMRTLAHYVLTDEEYAKIKAAVK